jgi:Ca-activated chloride channel family protein
MALVFTLGSSAWDVLKTAGTNGTATPVGQSWAAESAELTVAVAPGMAPTFQKLADDFNAQKNKTPDGGVMTVKVVVIAPDQMVEQSVKNPAFQAVAPDSSIWLARIEQRWIATQGLTDTAESSLIPISDRRVGMPVRYAVSPVVIAAWEDVARELGWPETVGWRRIQQRATEDPNFKWNHPSTGQASGLLATLAEFYAGAGVTRDLTAELAQKQETLDYVRAVEGTIRFYGEGESVIIEHLEAEGRGFLDAFATQEQVVLAWNQKHPDQKLVAIYPAEGTLWTDHPLALLELGAEGETRVTDNQRLTFQELAAYLTSADVQKQLLAAGYRPADLSLRLDGEGSPFAGTNAVDWRQPQTTLQMPGPDVVDVVMNVWWYTKRPTNVILVVDTSGSMEGTKIARTREALLAFVNQIQGPRDRVGILEFSNEIKLEVPLTQMTPENRKKLSDQIQGMQSDGDTAMIDAVLRARQTLEETGDPEAINAIVVMTDGQENSSRADLNDLQTAFGANQEKRVVIFTIAFGSDADEKLLKKIAELGDGQFRRATEMDIQELYKVISTYF